MILLSGIRDIYPSRAILPAALARVIFPAAAVSQALQFSRCNHPYRQLQIGTVIVLMVYKPCLRNIHGLVVIRRKSWLLISCPCLDTHLLLILKGRRPEYRYRKTHLIGNSQLSDPRTRRDPGTAAAYPTASAQHNTPIQTLGSNRTHHVLFQLSRHDRGHEDRLLCRLLPRVL